MFLYIPPTHMCSQVVKARLFKINISYHSRNFLSHKRCVVNKEELEAITEAFSSTLVRSLYEPLLSPLKSCPTDKGNFPRSCGQLGKQVLVLLAPCRKCHHVTIPENPVCATWPQGGGSLVPFFSASSMAMIHIWQENQRSPVWGIGKPLTLSVDS